MCGLSICLFVHIRQKMVLRQEWSDQKAHPEPWVLESWGSLQVRNEIYGSRQW